LSTAQNQAALELDDPLLLEVDDEEDVEDDEESDDLAADPESEEDEDEDEEADDSDLAGTELLPVERLSVR